MNVGLFPVQRRIDVFKPAKDATQEESRAASTHVEAIQRALINATNTALQTRRPVPLHRIHLHPLLHPPLPENQNVAEPLAHVAVHAISKVAEHVALSEPAMEYSARSLVHATVQMAPNPHRMAHAVGAHQRTLLSFLRQDGADSSRVLCNGLSGP